MRIRLIFIIGISLVLAILFSIYVSFVRNSILENREELACPIHNSTCTELELPVEFSNSSKEVRVRVQALSKKRDISKYGRQQPGHFEVEPTKYGSYTLSFLETTERLSYEYAKVGNLKKAEEMIEEMNASYTNSLFLNRLSRADSYYKSPPRYRQITDKFNVKDIPLILNIFKEDRSHENKSNFIKALFALSIAKHKQGDISFAHDVAKIMEAFPQRRRHVSLRQFIGIYILIDDKDQLSSILENHPQQAKGHDIQKALKEKDPSIFLPNYRTNHYGHTCGLHGDVYYACTNNLTFKEYETNKNITVNNYMQHIKNTCIQKRSTERALLKKGKRRITNYCIKHSKENIGDILYDIATSKDRKKYFTGYLNLLSMISNDKDVIRNIKNNTRNIKKITIAKHLMQPDKYPLFIEDLFLIEYMYGRSHGQLRRTAELLYKAGLKNAYNDYLLFQHQHSARQSVYRAVKQFYYLTMTYIKYGELDKAEETLLDILEYARPILKTGYKSNYLFRQDRAYYHLSSLMENETDIVRILEKVKTPIWHNSIRYTLAKKLINDGKKERAKYFLQEVPTYKEEYPDLLRMMFSLRHPHKGPFYPHEKNTSIEFEKDFKPIHERIFVLNNLKSKNQARYYTLHLRNFAKMAREKTMKKILLTASYNVLYVQTIKAKEAAQKIFQEVFDNFDREINF